MADRLNNTGDAVICLLGFIAGATVTSLFVGPSSSEPEVPEKIEWLFDSSEEMKRTQSNSEGPLDATEGMK